MPRIKYPIDLEKLKILKIYKLVIQRCNNLFR